MENQEESTQPEPCVPLLCSEPGCGRQPSQPHWALCIVHCALCPTEEDECLEHMTPFFSSFFFLQKKQAGNDSGEKAS